MGLEATCECKIDGTPYPVRAFLESRELILRGGVRRKIRLDNIAEAAVIGSRLQFIADAQTIELQLGTDVAQKWLKKISSPPPTLAAKLAIRDTVKVFLIDGQLCSELTSAVGGHVTANIEEADMICAVATHEQQLQKVVAVATERASCPIWIIHPKGKSSTLSETSVRDVMRAAGYVDTKVSAVSDQLTAARYNPRKV